MTRHGTRSRWAALVAGAVVMLTIAGCGGAPHPSPSATQLPSGITATLVQLRDDAATREAHVRIRNGADDPLRVGEVTIEDPRFDGTARRAIARESEVAAGGTVNVRVLLPPMDCTAEDEGSPTLEVEFGVGASESIARMEIDDTLGFLPELHRRECLADGP